MFVLLGEGWEGLGESWGAAVSFWAKGLSFLVDTSIEMFCDLWKCCIPISIVVAGE